MQIPITGSGADTAGKSLKEWTVNKRYLVLKDSLDSLDRVKIMQVCGMVLIRTVRIEERDEESERK